MTTCAVTASAHHLKAMCAALPRSGVDAIEIPAQGYMPDETLLSAMVAMQAELENIKKASKEQSDRLAAFKYDGSDDAVGGLRSGAEWLDQSFLAARQSFKGHLSAADARSDAAGTQSSRLSHSEWYDGIADLIEDQSENWLSKYAEFLEKYAGILAEVSDILSQLSKFVEAANDNETTIKRNDLCMQLQELLSSVYYARPDAMMKFDTEAEAQAFLAELGIEGFVVKRSNDGSGFAIAMDQSNPLHSLRDHFLVINNDRDETWDNARYNAWLEGKNSLFEQIQSAGRIIGEKNQRAMSQFDNMVRILSAAVDTISQADKAFITNLV